MAEPSLESNIVGLAAASAKTATKLFNLADSLKPNHHGIISIAGSVTALSLSLTHLSNALHTKQTAVSEREELAAAIVQLCRTLLTDSDDLVENVELLAKDEKCDEEDTGMRLGWMFEKAKFATLKQSLERLKATICLLIVAMSHASAFETGSQDVAMYVHHMSYVDSFVLANMSTATASGFRWIASKPKLAQTRLRRPNHRSTLPRKPRRPHLSPKSLFYKKVF
jgi:hypothetical protein